jgi:amino acid transporter
VRGLPRTEMLLVLACAAAAAMLAVSQFTDIFHLTPPGGEALAAIDASDQHGYATLVLAVFALILLVVAMGFRGEQLGQVAAMALAVCGLVALLIFLIGDLPKVNNVGTLDDPRQSFIDAEAKPVAGFWLELIGSLVLTVCGVALATMRPETTGPTHHERRRKPSLARTQVGRRSERTDQVRERDVRPRTPRDEGLQAPLRREDPPYQR